MNGSYSIMPTSVAGTAGFGGRTRIIGNIDINTPLIAVTFHF
jgi:hypothetical protein